MSSRRRIVSRSVPQAMSFSLPKPPCLGRRGGRQERTGSPAEEGAVHPQGRNAVEDRRSRLRRAAAGLEGSDAHLAGRGTYAGAQSAPTALAGPQVQRERSDLAARPRGHDNAGTTPRHTCQRPVD